MPRRPGVRFDAALWPPRPAPPRHRLRRPAPLPTPGCAPGRGADAPDRSAFLRRTGGGCRPLRRPRECRDATKRLPRRCRHRVASRWHRRPQAAPPPWRRPGARPAMGPADRRRPTTPLAGPRPGGQDPPAHHTAPATPRRHRRPSARATLRVNAAPRAPAWSRKPPRPRASLSVAAARRSRRRALAVGCFRRDRFRSPVGHTRLRPARHPPRCSPPGPDRYAWDGAFAPTPGCRSRGDRAPGARSPCR